MAKFNTALDLIQGVDNAYEKITLTVSFNTKWKKTTQH